MQITFVYPTNSLMIQNTETASSICPIIYVPLHHAKHHSWQLPVRNPYQVTIAFPACA